MNKTEIENIFDDRIGELNRILKGSLTYTERKVYDGRLLEMEAMKDRLIEKLFTEKQIDKINQN